MKEKIIKKLGRQGLLIIAVLFFAGLLCIATQSPVGALAGALPVIFGMATATGSDSISNLRTAKYTNAGATAVGDVIVANGCVLVAVNAAAAAAENVYIYQGKMTFPKEAALAVSVLDPVYWDSTNGVVTKTERGNTPCGFCVEKALAADTTVVVMMIPNAEILLPVGKVTQPKMKTKAVVALADAAATLTAAQLIDSGIFTITPTVARALTTETAANLVAGMPGAQVNSWFDFSVVCLAAFAATVGGGAGVALVGSGAVNNASGTFRAVFTNVSAGTEAVTIYRIA